MERFGEWFPGVIAIAPLDAPGPAEVGKVYVETVRLPLRGLRQIHLQVREARAPWFFATEGRLPPLLPRMEITLQDTAADACELTWRMLSRGRGPAVQYLLVPLARRVVGRRAARGLAALKARMEGGAQ